MTFRHLKKNEPCKVCGESGRGCVEKEGVDGVLYFCRGDNPNSGFHYIKPDKSGVWDMYILKTAKDAQDRESELERNRRREQYIAKRKAQEEKRAREYKTGLPIEERDRQFRSLLSQLSLKAEHREDLRRRGLTSAQIQKGMFRSVTEEAIPLTIPLSEYLPGIWDWGKSFKSPKDGYICPIFNPSGLIIGCQIRADDGSNGRYVWPKTKKSSHLRIGELPITSHIEADDEDIRIVEGILKPYIAHCRRKQSYLGTGVAHGNFSLSPKQFKAYLETIEPKRIILCPDAGGRKNPNVLASYQEIAKILESWGKPLWIEDWGQSDAKEGQLDVDEIDTQATTKIIPFAEWVSQAKIKKNRQQKVTTDKLSKRWDKASVLEEIEQLAGRRVQKKRLPVEIKDISNKSGWDIPTLREAYKQTLISVDTEIEIEEDVKEFDEIRNSNVELRCKAMLPKELYPVFRFADNLGVPYEPVLVALEATAASLIDPNTKVIGRKSSNYDQNSTIFSAILGKPASKKSPLIKAIARKPLAKLQEKSLEVFKLEQARYERDLNKWEALDKTERGEKPEPPSMRIYSTGDYTPEGLRELVQQNPKMLRCFDELAREQKSQGQYKGGKGGDAQLLLESFDGLIDTVVRRGKVYPGRTTNQCLLGGIQPEVMSEIISTSDPTGLFARYNIATLPTEPHLWNGDTETSVDITPLLMAVYEGIDQLESMTFRLSPDAYKLFEKCHNHAEQKKTTVDSDAMVYQYGKMSGKILRWAMVYHILWAIAQGNRPSEIIEDKFIRIAKERAAYQIAQVKSLLSIMDKSDASRLYQLYEYALRKGTAISPRDACKSKKAGDREEAIELFRRLEQMGYGQAQETNRTIKFIAFPEKIQKEVSGGNSQDGENQNTSDACQKEGDKQLSEVSAEKHEVGLDSNPLPERDTPQLSEVSGGNSQDGENQNTSDACQKEGDKQLSEVSAEKHEVGLDSNPLPERDTPQLSEVSGGNSKTNKILEDMVNCQNMHDLATVRDKYPTEDFRRTFYLMKDSSDPALVQKSWKIKRWLYEINLGQPLRVGVTVHLRREDSYCQNWLIKAIEKDSLWIEKVGTKHTERIDFSEIREIFSRNKDTGDQQSIETPEESSPVNNADSLHNEPSEEIGKINNDEPLEVVFDFEIGDKVKDLYREKENPGVIYEIKSREVRCDGNYYEIQSEKSPLIVEPEFVLELAED